MTVTTAPAQSETFMIMFTVVDSGGYYSRNRTVTGKVEGENAAHTQAAELSIQNPGQVVSIFPPAQAPHSSYIDGRAMRLNGEMV